MEFRTMKQSSSIGLIGACILATSVAIVPMTLPASAQTTTTPRTGTGSTTGVTTERTYENNNDDRGLWGLAGLAGLFGLLGSKKRHDDSRSEMRDDTTLHRDPSRR
jgi:hypothetical protein